jgi:ribonucleoside-diphosphate reductase alpha chain
VLRREIKAARRNHVPDNYIKRVIQFAKQGYKDIDFPIYDTDWDSEAYLTVSGPEFQQHGARHRRVLKAVEADKSWDLTWRTKPGKIAKTVKARDLWEKIGYAAWASADPGLQFHSTINDWHTCPASGPIIASNPCSEYMFLDDTACNLASMNLLAFLAKDLGQGEPRIFDVDGYEHAVRLWTVVLEIAVLMAQFPSKQIALRSYEFRTLGLGYANVGGLLMSAGIPYDSDAGRQICGTLTSILTGISYATSAEMAKELGPFPGYKKNREAMLRVMRNHRRAAYGERSGYEQVATPPVPLDHKTCPDQALVEHAKRAWDRVVEHGTRYGFRNAQVSVVAPTGTIGLVMDCDTTGIEPDFALVKFKKLAGGGYFKIINRAVPEALRVLGYSTAEIAEVEAYAVGHGSLGQSPGINHSTLKAKGFTDEAIATSRRRCPPPSTSSSCSTSGRSARASASTRSASSRPPINDPKFDLLTAIGFTKREIDAANIHVCGAMTVEGAPHLQGRALRGVRLRQSVRAHRQALSLGREPHPHAGVGAAVHHGRDLQDHQHAERRHGRGLQGGLPAVLEARPERPMRSIATAQSSRSRCRAS